MWSSEKAAWQRRINSFGEKTHSKEELQELINNALTPGKRTWTKHKKREDCNYKTRPVQVFTVEGGFIGEYNSLSQASEATGVFVAQILKCLRKECTSAKGYIFLDRSDENQAVV